MHKRFRKELESERMDICGHVTRFNGTMTLLLGVAAFTLGLIAGVWILASDVPVDGPPGSRLFLATLMFAMSFFMARELYATVTWFEFDGKSLAVRRAFRRLTIKVPISRIKSADTRWAGYWHKLYDVRLADGTRLVFGHAMLSNATRIGETLMNVHENQVDEHPRD